MHGLGLAAAFVLAMALVPAEVGRRTASPRPESLRDRAAGSLQQHGPVFPHRDGPVSPYRDGPVSLFARGSGAVRASDESPAVRGDASYLVEDVATGRVLDLRWDDSDRPVSMGSLIKPFTSMAYAEGHRFAYPVFTCRGSRDGCWDPRGHGRVAIVSAIANSCNAYFHQLSRLTPADRLTSTLRALGMAGVPDSVAAASLVGLGDGLRLTPESMVHGYREIASRASQAGVAPIIAGLTESARSGTGSAVGAAVGAAGALVKTGTAPCSHVPRGAGDGYTVALYPAASPRVVVLVQVHGTTGAEAAIAAGALLRRTVGAR